MAPLRSALHGRCVAAALETLTDLQLEVVGLHYLADLPVAAVAAHLGVPEGTIKSTLFDARARLRAEIDGRGAHHD